jgi:hypothetical protein
MASLHFERRTWAQARRVATSVGIEPRAQEEILHPRFDVKALDAALALRTSRYASNANDGQLGAAP